jgi:hypothetical protein
LARPSAREATKAAKAAKAAEASALAGLGLSVGEEVRFQRPDRSRWQAGVVRRLERDGSIGLTDANGGARAVALTQVRVRVRARRSGGTPPDRWEPLADRAARTEQLTLL